MDEDLETPGRVPPGEGFGRYSLLFRLSQKHNMGRTRDALERLFVGRSVGKGQGRDAA